MLIYTKLNREKQTSLPLILLMRGSDKMLELEENIRLLEELKTKLQNLGESL